MTSRPTRALIILLSAACAFASQARQSDNGDGTFTNPPLYADFPDPDIIRVGDDFYFATTTFVNSPGLTILHSKDLVNWEYLSHVMPKLDGADAYDMKGGTAYRGGVFAPSLRYHDGLFYVAVNPNGQGQNLRIYTAKDPRGPWEMHQLDRPAFDPGLFIDDTGAAYVITSGGWDGTAMLLTLDASLSKVLAEEKIHFNEGAEGTKVIKRGDWYYMFNAIPRRLGMTVSRAKDLRGPWETKDQGDDRTVGHQGAIVDLPDGSYYGFAMIDKPFPGRMTRIGPIFWENDWPVWGTKEEPGKIPAKAQKPVQGQPAKIPATSDEFDAPQLGLQWQWNHNPDDSRWSLKDRAGWLRLKPTKSSGFWTARNTLTQKGWGPRSTAEVKLDLRNLKPGDVCGFGTLGKFNGHIAVTRGKDAKLALGMEVIEDTTSGPKAEVRVKDQPIDAQDLYLRADMDLETGKAKCSYSTDGKTWKELGGEFDVRFDWQTGTFQGPQYALFCYNPEPGAGYVDVDYFRVDDKPRP